MIFEESWEVCNKVGGIYTVVSTKAKYYVEKYRDKYFLIGPYKDPYEFVEKEKPDWLKEINKKVEENGIKIYYGYWDIDGKPQTILVDFYELFKEKNIWKYRYWDWYKIDSLNSDFTFDEPLLWSISVGIFLEEIDRKFPEKKILHAHEWLSGGTILYIKKKNLNYKTILTIHGTVLGRTVSNMGIDIFKLLDKINPDQDSYRLNVNAKFQLEKASVLNSDIFTTVSDILDIEAQRMFGRKSDKILYNSLNIKKKEIEKDYFIGRKILEEFSLWYFYPYYEIDLNNTVFGYTIGRYEFFNKGYDLVIDLLKYLNERINFNIIFFLFVPSSISGIDPEVYKIYRNYQKIKNNLKENTFEILKDLYKKGYFSLDIIKYKGKNPPICTHILSNKDDIIYKKILENNLTNKIEDKVKVIYVPVYIGQDQIFNFDMEEILPGFDFGIFLSRYEPYGYTPLEALSNGIPIILSKRTGFYYALEKKRISSRSILGIDIEKFNEEKELIEKFINNYYSKDIVDMLEIKKEAYNVSLNFDWGKNIDEYFDLYTY